MIDLTCEVTDVDKIDFTGYITDVDDGGIK